MIKIGTVNIDTSHAPSFAEILLKEDRARYTAIYNDSFRTEEEVNAFCERFGLAHKCKTLEEMVPLVDVAFIQGCDWDKHIETCRPFVEAGVPVFVDKPLCGNKKDMDIFRAWAKEGKVILGTSAMRYTYEHQAFFAVPAEERGEICHITATVGVDEFNYAIHAVESITGLLNGVKAKSVKYVGCGTTDGAPTETFFVLFENGVSATYHVRMKGWQPSTLTIVTTKTTYVYKIDSNKVYEAMLKEFCNCMEGKESMMASVEDMLTSIEIMLAGRLSRENGGVEVDPNNIPADDKGFDGYKFWVGYAAAQRK